MTEQPFRPLAEAIGAWAANRYEQAQVPAGTRCRIVNKRGGAYEIELEEPIEGETRWFVARDALKFREEA